MESLVAGHEVVLRRDGRDVGVLGFCPSVLEGTVVAGPSLVSGGEDPVGVRDGAVRDEAVPDGVTVVATASKLSDAARRRLSDELGPDYIVVDLLKAPPTTDVVLTHSVSPQLLGALRAGFPTARVIVAEIDDEELGVHYPGPVSRLLDAGASAYLPPRPLREVASTMHAYLTGTGVPQLTAAAPVDGANATLPSSPAGAGPQSQAPRPDAPRPR